MKKLSIVILVILSWLFVSAFISNCQAAGVGVGRITSSDLVETSSFLTNEHIMLIKADGTIKKIALGNVVLNQSDTNNIAAMIWGLGLGVTNYSSNFINTFSKTLFVETNGNDSTGKPYRTLEVAHSAANPGDTINIGVGLFTNVADLVLKRGIILNGSGQNSTTIHSRTSNTLTVTNDVVVKNLTIYNITPAPALAMPLTTPAQGSTNISLLNCKFVGFSDALFPRGATINFVADNCFFEAAYDCYNGGNVDTNSTFTFNNCRFNADARILGGNISQDVRCVNSRQGTNIFNNCVFNAYGNNTPVLTCINYSTPGNIVILNNCSFNVGGTCSDGMYLGIYSGGAAINNMTWDNDVEYVTNGLKNIFVNGGSIDMTHVNGPIMYNGIETWGGIFNTNAVPVTNLFQRGLSGRFVMPSGQLASVVTNNAVTTNSIISASISSIVAATNRLFFQADSGLIRFQLPVVGAVNTPISWQLFQP